MNRAIHRFSIGRFAPALAAIAAFALAGCGGHIILDAPDSGGRATSADDRNDGGDSTSPEGSLLFPLCPPEAPQTGSVCPWANQGCVYQNFQEKTCASWTCDESQHWMVSTPAGC